MNEHPALWLLFGAYLNLDWYDEYGTLWGAVDAFVDEEPDASELPAEVDALLAATDRDEAVLRVIVVGDMGSGYLPDEDESTIASWLADVARHVRARLDARPAE